MNAMKKNALCVGTKADKLSRNECARSLAQAEKLDREIKLAREIQMSTLPSEMPPISEGSAPMLLSSSDTSALAPSGVLPFISASISYQAPVSAFLRLSGAPVLTTIKSMISPGICEESNTSLAPGAERAFSEDVWRRAVVEQAVVKYGLNPNKPNPVTQ